MGAVGDGDGHFLPVLPVTGQVSTAALGRQHDLGDVVPVHDLAAVQADILASGFPVPGYDAAERVQVTPPVQFLPDRRGELVQVDVSARQYVLFDRRVPDNDRLHGIGVRLFQVAHDVLVAGFGRQSQYGAQLPFIAHCAGHETGRAGIPVPLDVLEQQGGACQSQVDAGDCAQFQVRVHLALNLPELIRLMQLPQPGTQAGFSLRQYSQAGVEVVRIHHRNSALC